MLETIECNENYILGTLNVKSLYTIIEKQKVVKQQTIFERYEYPTEWTDVIVNCTKFILTHDYFIYEDDFY